MTTHLAPGEIHRRWLPPLSLWLIMANIPEDKLNKLITAGRRQQIFDALK